jgi:hypothetical protein
MKQTNASNHSTLQPGISTYIAFRNNISDVAAACQFEVSNLAVN